VESESEDEFSCLGSVKFFFEVTEGNAASFGCCLLEEISVFFCPICEEEF
jgi:hypothetical protein